MSQEQITSVNAIAPTRICDIGGWTDTWFAGHGSIFNIAVYPYVDVQVSILRDEESAGKIFLSMENYDDKYQFDSSKKIDGPLGSKLFLREGKGGEFGKYPLVEKAVEIMDTPMDVGYSISVYSDAPPGASIGTSAAVSVALIASLDRLSDGHLTAHEIAQMAHSIETKYLNLECGVQDQLASAYGGINFIDVNRYPYSVVSPVPISDQIWWELEQRLALVYIGIPHESSAIHKIVIESLGKTPSLDNRIEKLRVLARRAKNALIDGNFVEFGDIMNESTAVQKSMHPELVCSQFREIIDIVKHYKALGCKVNGAGGDGGSLSILFGECREDKRKCLKVLEEKGFNILPIYLARRGLRVWESRG